MPFPQVLSNYVTLGNRCERLNCHALNSEQINGLITFDYLKQL